MAPHLCAAELTDFVRPFELLSIYFDTFREEKMMEVCDICGAFLIVGDAQSRIDDHLMGKQHMGYAKLRNCLGT